MAALTFTPADVAFWQREVDHWAAAWEAAWAARAQPEIEAARVAIRALLDLRDVIQTESNAAECGRETDMTKTYGVSSGDGTRCGMGMTLDQARRKAWQVAEESGETAEIFDCASGDTVEAQEAPKRLAAQGSERPVIPKS